MLCRSLRLATCLQQGWLTQLRQLDFNFNKEIRGGQNDVENCTKAGD